MESDPPHDSQQKRAMSIALQTDTFRPFAPEVQRLPSHLASPACPPLRAELCGNTPAFVVLKRIARRCGCLIVAALVAFTLGSISATAQDTKAPEGAVKAQHGDWQVVCKSPPPGSKKEVCALVQSVTAEDRNNVGLTVYFQKFANGTRVLRVFAPLGILLPPGLGLKIDNKDVGHAPFLRCHSFACYAQVVVEDKLVEQLKTGKTAIFIIFQTEEAGIGIPISLSGFAEALPEIE